MATNYDSNFSFHEQLWYYYTSNRGKIRSRYNDLTRKFLAYNDSEENPHAFLRRPQFEALEMYVFVKEFMGNPQVYQMFYPQLGVKLCSMAGGGVQKIYMVFLREPSRRDRSGSDLFHLRDGFEIKMNFDRNVSCFIFVNALMHDDFFD